MTFTFLETADVHGNKGQIYVALKRAEELGLHAVIFGGDIAPKEGNEIDGPHWIPGHKTRNPEAQARFYKEWMIPTFDEFTSATGIEVYAMMGNDDFIVNMPILEEADEAGQLRLLHERAHELPSGIFLVGMSYISPTPFGNKDWEIWDLKTPSDTDQRNRYDGGIATLDNGSRDVDFSKIPRANSLETYLLETIKPLSDPRRTIYGFHNPPYDTPADQMKDKEGKVIKIGSRAERAYIERHQPILVSGGHIHECVRVSGKFEGRIGGTVVVYPGNDPHNRPSENYTSYRRNLKAVVGEVNGDRINLLRESIDFVPTGNKFRITNIETRK
tara:strand:- start:288 stop:1277 length:990 start_codon:yes stop_codon:yes gene_type:complete